MDRALAQAPQRQRGLVFDLDHALEENGYWCGPFLTHFAVCRMRAYIAENFARRIERLGLIGETRQKLLEAGPWGYAKTQHLVEHGNLWPVSERCFTPHQVANLEVYLRGKLPWDFDVSAEDTPSAKVVWRMVRPGHPEDVGPVHADQWFWDANDWECPWGTRPLKIWIMIGDGDRGLCVAPASHRCAWDYSVEWRDGKFKPVFDPAKHNIEMLPLVTPAGHAALFDHDLLHGGVPTPPDQPCRISIEATLLIKE